VAQFDVSRVSKNPARFDEQKLRWMNGRYLRELSTEELTARLEAFTGRFDLGPAVALSREKMQTLAEFWPLAGFLFDGPVDDPAAREKWLDSDGLGALADARAALADVDPFDVEHLEPALQKVIEKRNAKPRDVYQPIRVAIAGIPVSPGIFESLEVLGKAEALRRMDAALQI
jgi:glutamyl/glutaminyl-tRNA synthetase